MSETETTPKNSSDTKSSSDEGKSYSRNNEYRGSEYRGSENRGSEHRGSAAGAADRPKAGAMEVIVEHNIEKAMKILKRKLIKEGLFKELKARRYFEKPSERKKRKLKESIKKTRKEESRNRRSLLGNI